MIEQLHPVAVARQRLGIGHVTLYKLIGSGELRSVKIGARRLIPESAIVDFIAARVAAAEAGAA